MRNWHYNNPVVERKRWKEDAPQWYNPFSWFNEGGNDNNDSDISAGTVVTTPTATPAPEYPEAVQARGDWAKTLQTWGTQPGYGVVQPDYNDIYNKAAEKIGRYYWGGPSQPGVNQKINASLARRNVSESPAAQVMAQRSGAEEANQLGQLSTAVGTTKAAANEQGRLNWLTSMQNLANMREPYLTGSVKDVFVPLNTAPAEQATGGWLDNLLRGFNLNNMPNTTQSSITDEQPYGSMLGSDQYGYDNSSDPYGEFSGNYGDWQNTQGWWGQ